MAFTGQMVKINGTLARVDIEYRDYARVLTIDNRGRIRQSWHYINELVPLHIAYGPHTTWPERGDLDRRQDELEEREARAAEKAQQKAARKARRRGFRKAAA